MLSALYEGWLSKKGKLNKSWKCRYFILSSNGRLAYYDNEGKTKANGSIDLCLATGISTHKHDNTDMLYVLETESEENEFDGLNKRKSLRMSRQESIAYIIKLYTPKRIWYLRCKGADAMNKWAMQMKQVIYGNIVYEAYLLIYDDDEYIARWCVLTDKYELRIYQDETQSQLKDCLSMKELNMICCNDNKEMKFTWNDEIFSVATSSCRTRNIWMNKFAQLMSNVYDDKLYTLDVLMEGYLWIFIQRERRLKLSTNYKKYCAIDRQYNMYFSADLHSFQCFSNGLYFDANKFEEHKDNVMDGYISLNERRNTFKCGELRNEHILQLFVVMIQESDPKIFYIEYQDNLIYFVASSKNEIKLWLDCLRIFQRKHCRERTVDILSQISTRHVHSKSNIQKEKGNDLISMLTQTNGKEEKETEKEIYWCLMWKQMMKNKQFKETCTECKSIEKCPYFERICFIMQFYDDWCGIKSKLKTPNDHQISPIAPSNVSARLRFKSHKSLSPHTNGSYTCNDDNAGDDDDDGIYAYLHEYFVGYSITQLIDDYYHLYVYHKYNDDDFHFMYNHLPKTIHAANDTQCRVDICDIMSRNERDKRISYSRYTLYYGYRDVKEISCMQLLDRIHCVLYHSFDLFRLTQKEQSMISNNIDCDYNEYVHKIMKTKQNKLISIRHQFDTNCNKFLTEIVAHTDDEKHDNILNNTQSPLNTGSQSMNEFGVCFSYWIEDENDVSLLYLAPKYANLKQEILSNKLCTISRNDWDHTFCNSHNLLLSLHCKDLIADLTEAQVRKYKIADGSAIAINHLQSLLLYCNYGDSLHKYLTYSYREYDLENNLKRFSYNELIQRHSEFGNWAKYLTECVTIFGAHFVSSSQFYHGITTKYRFSDFRIYYNYPISVTTKANIAAEFVSVNGIVLRLNRCGMMSEVKVIQCSFLSHTEYEEEVLLVFADRRPLKITSIIELNTSYSYYSHLCAIDILDDIINGRNIKQSHLENELNIKRLQEMLQFKLNTCMSTQQMDYIYQLFIAYCDNQDNLIKFDVNLEERLNAYISRFFIENKDETVPCLKMESLIRLFPNAKAFEIKCPVLHSFIFDSIVTILNDKLIQNINSQMHQITFKWINCIQQQHCDIDEIVTTYTHKFKMYSWIIEKKHKYGFDYLVIKAVY